MSCLLYLPDDSDMYLSFENHGAIGFQEGQIHVSLEFLGKVF